MEQVNYAVYFVLLLEFLVLIHLKRRNLVNAVYHFLIIAFPKVHIGQKGINTCLSETSGIGSLDRILDDGVLNHILKFLGHESHQFLNCGGSHHEALDSAGVIGGRLGHKRDSPVGTSQIPMAEVTYGKSLSHIGIQVLGGVVRVLVTDGGSLLQYSIGTVDCRIETIP